MSDTQVPPGDAREDSWAKKVTHLDVGAIEGADAGSVQGRRLTGPIQGFGKMWQKTYTVRIPGERVTPEHVISEWRANYGKFWPKGNRFYAPVSGIKPGDVGLISGKAGGLTLSTGVLVLYSDDTSFSFMTPEGHPFAGLINFSAFTGPDGVTVAQVSLLIRAQDPIMDVGMLLMGHRKEDKMWQETLRNLAAHFGVQSEVDTLVVCVDKKRQWKYFGNIRHDAAFYAMTKPFRRKRPAVEATVAETVAADRQAAAEVGARSRPVYDRIGVLGLVLIAGTLAVWLASGILTGMGDDAGFLAVFLAVPTVVAFLQWRFGTWATVLGLVTSALAGLSMFWAVFGLSTPGSILDFVGGITIPLGTVLGIVGSAAALVQKRRGRTTTTATLGERRIVRVVAGIVAVAVVGSALVSFTGREQVDAAAAAGAVDVAMAGSKFTPATIESAAGGKLLVRNNDAFAHDFAVPALGIEAIALNPGSSALVELGGAAAGTYTAYCTLHSDTDVADAEEAGMAATLIVK